MSVFWASELSRSLPHEEHAEYWFEAPGHKGVVFENLELAELYADVNGFKEEGMGEHGVPPGIIPGRDGYPPAYLLTRPRIDTNWVSSFFGVEREKAERYV